MYTSLPEAHLKILKDLNRFSTIKRYHGLLPEKLALFYDHQALQDLKSCGFVEEGVIVSRCGSRLRGYRLTENCRAEIKRMGLDLGEAKLDGLSFLPEEELSSEQVAILRDVYHLSHLSVNCGITPKEELTKFHDKALIKSVYNLGLILYIRLKGVCGENNRKGYILSDLGHKVLLHLDNLR